ncbi:MAG: hypothetical protein IID35_06275 [Planctomycetes bacterium]|nr:hypothetical protein [Planctomycetota bacterium]
MIEFKAECGHTVRAKDEDAGGVVRCSYCGRTATVPDTDSSDLSFLFKEVDQGGGDAGSRRRKKGRGLFGGRKRLSGEFNPFAVVFRLCYIAVLIIVVVVVLRKVVIPLFDSESRSKMFAGRPGESARDTRDSADLGRRGSQRRPGLIGVANQDGLFVGSTPPGAAVFCIEESKAPVTGRIDGLSTCTRFKANTRTVRVTDGTYVVEVVFAWNDPSLSDSRLSNYRDYIAFRKEVERASPTDRRRLVNEFFVPDEAAEVFIDQTVEQYYIVRQYRGVTVRQGRSSGVRALFLPRLPTAGGESFAIEPLVTGYIPTKKSYIFNAEYVRRELADYYGVAMADQAFVVEALQRIGLIPYVTPDRKVRLFKIGIHDGVFAAPVLRAAGQ